MWIGIEFDFWNIGSKITLVRFFVFIFLFTSASRAICLIVFLFFFFSCWIFFSSVVFDSKLFVNIFGKRNYYRV